ncbi:hypothetical protein CPB83DRAFT_901310 [Crepidotus variabilis]|uniref:Uncharacterized protein n=1 Tax=Crepidotus variabilis TaxID=179855 RepID=A0A9P6EVL8_9AGAR|nr:hypothetical protein CPB83DRAFT_901310 [Crepidotus variabilis]
MFKFLAAAISAVFLINSVVALPAPDNAVQPALSARSPALIDVNADVLSKRNGPIPPHPEYPWSVPPLLDIDLDLIVKLGKAKLIDVDLDLDIFKGHIKRNGIPPPPPDLPLLVVDLDVILSLAKQKLVYLGADAAILTKRTNSYAWWYPLIDIDLDLVVKLVQTKILDLNLDIDLLKKLGLIKRNAFPPSPPLVLIDIDLIVKLLGIKLGH